jgi:methyl-accepting chemotaxis protein
MATFDDITLFGNTSLSDIFKQIHKNNKSVDSQINELIGALKPLASSNAGSAVMLMPTVKDLIDVNVKNNDQLIKMAGIAQRAANTTSNANDSLLDMSEIQLLLEEQNAIQEEGKKLLESANKDIQKQLA